MTESGGMKYNFSLTNTKYNMKYETLEVYRLPDSGKAIWKLTLTEEWFRRHQEALETLRWVENYHHVIEQALMQMGDDDNEDSLFKLALKDMPK